MADAYVNFYGRLDPRGAQAFETGANQPHRAAGAVGAAVASATEVPLVGGTFYAEVKPTAGSVFACVLPSNANEAAKTAARIRIDEGEKTTLCLTGNGVSGNSLFIWAV